MLAVLVCAALVLGASLLAGHAILVLCRWPRPAWLAGATGLAALVIVAPLLVRLPGRATTAAIATGVLLVGAGLFLRRREAERAPSSAWGLALAVVVITVALASLPFLFNERVGVLGEGIYTNDHAAQLYWSQWLAEGFGPQPSAVAFGYPVGPQAVAVIAAEVSGASLVAAFNGLLLAIPALTALTALGALAGLAPRRRVAAAVLAGLPYLGASFLAQSAFKETAMALFVLAFAIALADRERAGWRAVAIVGALLAAAAVFTFSIPGLAWFALTLPIWLALELVAGRLTVDWPDAGEWLRRHRPAAAVALVAVIAVAAVAIGPANDFIAKIDDVQASAGRLSSPVFPGEALGLWPAGDFRIVRGEVGGALIAVALAALAAAYGVWVLIRERRTALLAMLIAGGIVYVGTRLFAEIHVEAKALAVIAPLVLLVSLRALLAPAAPTERRHRTLIRQAAGALLVAGALLSTLVALRAAPVGYDDRQLALERLAERAGGEPLVFLGVDRFSGYYLRETLMRAPAGYVPEEIEGRPEKRWNQGLVVDFDTLESRQLDKFDYAITTTAAYASAPPKSFRPLAEDGDYVLWERAGATPRSRVLDEGDAPGADECIGRPALASVFAATPALADGGWRGPEPVADAAAGQESAFLAPATARNQLELESAGEYELSLQYHSQVPLEVVVEGEVVAELPPSLEGFYLDGAGRGAFWPAGELSAEAGPLAVEVRAREPSGLQRALGVERRVWLGRLAATAITDPVDAELSGRCGPYVDHFKLPRLGAGS